MIKPTSKFQTNSSQCARVMIQCRTLVNREAVSRKSIDGVEHIIVSSATLPDDIVMNGGLYPAEEIAASFETLELTLSPVEHPTINGQFISANDPRAIHDFHAGAFNMNVRRENGRVHIDKFINVAEALKTDRGKRLLDRIDELENNDNPRPIHTSVGVFITPEELSEPQTNAAGDAFTWIARDMVFDHDAILLDSVGAAQPHQGVGVAVNRQGEECRVDIHELPFAEVIDNEKTVTAALRSAAARLRQAQGPTDEEKESITSVINSYLNQLRNNEHQSFEQIHQSVTEALERSAINSDWIEQLFPFDNRVIFWSNDQLFEVEFVIDEQNFATIVGIPLPVERNVTFTPKTNSEGEAMKELILSALKTAGIETENKSDAELATAFQGLQANQSDSDDNGAPDNGDIATVVANAVAAATQPLADQIGNLQTKLDTADVAELDNLAGVVANSGKYPGLDADSAKLLPIDKLKEMAGNCQTAFGVSPVVNTGGGQSEQSLAPVNMPD